MRTAARKRNINLRLQLENFSRHKENTTYLNWKLGRFYWRVEWLFANIPLEAQHTRDHRGVPHNLRYLRIEATRRL